MGQARAVDRLLEWLGRAGDRVLLARTADGDTLAHLAARHGHPAAVLSFARHGVPLFMPNKVPHCSALRSSCFLCFSCSCCTLNNLKSMSGATLNWHNFWFNFQRGALCLHTAAEFGQASVVRAVLERGCNVDAKQKASFALLSSHTLCQYTFGA